MASLSKTPTTNRPMTRSLTFSNESKHETTTTTPSSKKSNGNQWCLTKDSKTCMSGKVYSVQVSAPSSTVKPFLKALEALGDELFENPVNSIQIFINEYGDNYMFSQNTKYSGNSLAGLTVENVDNGNITFFYDKGGGEEIGPVSMNEIVPNPNKKGGRRRRKSRKSLFKKKRTKKRKRRRRRKSKRKSPKRRKKTRRRRK